MRLYCVALLIGVTAATGASASSFVTVPAPASASSIVYYGTPAPATPPMSAAASTDLPALNYPAPTPPMAAAIAPAPQLSQSVIALGEPAVENFQVAAIAEKKPASHRPDLAPMVIRGGISGEMFVRASSPTAMPASSSSSQPAPEQAAATPRSAKQQARATPKPTPEPAAAPPPPSKLGRMPGVQ